MKCLITGASGFIGRYLQSLDHLDFCCVIRDGNKNNFESFFEVSGIDADTDWNGAFENVDSIIHLGGLAHKNIYTKAEYLSVNTAGTLRLANQAVKAGVRRFIFVSSIGVNGNSTQTLPFNESNIPAPSNYYSESKYLAELGLLKIMKETGLEVVIIRPPLVYGNNAPGNFCSLVNLVKKSPFLPFGLCKNKRSYISVGNLCDFICTCVSHPKASGEIFIVSDGPAISTKALTNAIAQAVGTSLKQLAVPIWLIRCVGNIFNKKNKVDQLLGDLEIDSSKARKLLNWFPPETMMQAIKKLK